MPPSIDSTALPAGKSRVKKLHLDLWLGSMLVLNNSALATNFEALTCIEVIEHLSSEAEALTAGVVALQSIQPNIAIFTTPNYETNTILSRLSGEKLDDSVIASGIMPFREADHKFEWTRSQFQAWAAQVCSELPVCCEQHKAVSPYSVDFADIGLLSQYEGGQSVGGASQAAIFRRRCPNKRLHDAKAPEEVSSSAESALNSTDSSIIADGDFTTPTPTDHLVLYRSVLLENES